MSAGIIILAESILVSADGRYVLHGLYDRLNILLEDFTQPIGLVNGFNIFGRISAERTGPCKVSVFLRDDKRQDYNASLMKFEHTVSVMPATMRNTQFSMNTGPLTFNLGLQHEVALHLNTSGQTLEVPTTIDLQVNGELVASTFLTLCLTKKKQP